MHEYKEVKHEVTKLELFAVTCNNCGLSHKITGPFDHDLNMFHDFIAEGGYGSTFPADMDVVSFTLCCDCINDITSKFKVSATSTNTDGLELIKIKLD